MAPNDAKKGRVPQPRTHKSANIFDRQRDTLTLSSVSLALNNNPPVESANDWKNLTSLKIRKCLWIYPLMASTLLPVFTLGAYIYAVQSNQVKAIFPFISDVIGLEPQAGLANTLFVIVNISILITGFLRYKQLKFYLRKQTRMTISSMKSFESRQMEILQNLNYVSFLFICLSSFGMFLIALCRLPENPVPHFIGLAILVFGINVYFLLMAYLSGKLNASCGIESRPVTLTIVSLAMLTFLTLMSMLGFISVYQAGFDNFLDNKWRFNWSEEEPGFQAHVASATLEWIGFVGCGSVLYLCLFRRILNFTDWHKVRFA